MASCLTPGLPPLVNVSIQPRGQHMSRITFLPQVSHYVSYHLGQEAVPRICCMNAFCNVNQPFGITLAGKLCCLACI